MDYTSPDAKWDAYQFSDPYAANAFVCGLKKNDVVCRPSCDFYPKSSAKDDVVFLDSVNQAIAAGYKPCKHCEVSVSKPLYEIELIKSTIEAINYSIGFNGSKSDSKKRALSTPSINTHDGHLSCDRQFTRNESEHAKLVELACRHIAAAAAESILKDDKPGNKKKRRGGVLGFKELAAKSKLSPWHFHRVFKSVTGLTPKSYGDQCWKHMENRQRNLQRCHFRSNSDITSNYNKPKRVKKEVSCAPDAPTLKSDIAIDLTPIISDSMPLNSNSLDINLATMRHHSLDLGSVGLDSFDLNGLIPEFTAPTSLPRPNDFQLNNQHTPSSTIDEKFIEQTWNSSAVQTPPSFTRLTPPSSCSDEIPFEFSNFNSDLNMNFNSQLNSYELLSSNEIQDCGVLFDTMDTNGSQEVLFDTRNYNSSSTLDLLA